MLLSKFSTDLSLIWPSSQSLNIDEKMNLELSLLKLHEHENFEEVLFWGKVRGIMKDYYIALTLKYRGSDEFPSKRFFWCTSQNWNFAELTPLSSDDQEFVERFNMNFSGEHDRIIVEAAEPSADDDDDSIVPSDNEKLPTKNFTELDRLSYVVRSIEHDCQVVPIGSFRMTPGNELVRNKVFEGLTMSALKDLKNFGHFRKVEQQDKKDLIHRGDALYSLEFLDPVDKDLPKGSWSLFVDPSGTLACLRSVLWPGYFGYHRAGSEHYGGVYFGDGIKHSDLAFMV